MEWFGEEKVRHSCALQIDNFCLHGKLRWILRAHVHPGNRKHCTAKTVGERDTQSKRGKNGRDDEENHLKFPPV